MCLSIAATAPARKPVDLSAKLRCVRGWVQPINMSRVERLDKTPVSPVHDCLHDRAWLLRTTTIHPGTKHAQGLDLVLQGGVMTNSCLVLFGSFLRAAFFLCHVLALREDFWVTWGHTHEQDRCSYRKPFMVIVSGERWVTIPSALVSFFI
jgi:hypothetical protein